MKQLFFDVETKKIFDEVGGHFPDKLGVSFVGTCWREGTTGSGEMKGFFEEELDDFFRLAGEADLLIGFNSLGFDLPALSPYYRGDLFKLQNLDLLDRIKKKLGHRISLDAVAKETIGRGKSGNGLDAIKYYQAGNRQALAEYCLEDVAITRDVYDYGLTKGKIKFRNKWNRLIEAEIDFSFVLQKDLGTQMSLI
ncbi:MAG TPA: ribonuclease H-like domain-containing protein [Candidatus Woesebacteria bacterium]|nr:ribonuclease H-like domain-containing protein [Candidatus Woesebacteria bacterium]